MLKNYNILFKTIQQILYNDIFLLRNFKENKSLKSIEGTRVISLLGLKKHRQI